MRAVWILVLSVGIATAQAQCPGRYKNKEVAGIAIGVAAAMCLLWLIGLGVFFLVRHFRNKTQQPGSQGTTPQKNPQTYENIAFEGDGSDAAAKKPQAQQRLSFAEQGFAGYVPSPDYGGPVKSKATVSSPSITVPGIQGASISNNNNDSLKRSLMSKFKPSLSPKTMGNARTGSQGSLDASCQNIEPDVISVALQSEDIIGLGFNITGSMRDGIYVSQVHNRGPASESGQIKPGDRIMGITISFENMVYEDALTILSYASPYPVRLQLQKNTPKSSGKGQVVAGVDDEGLHHPVYRSQSMDDVSKIARESLFNVRRARSEMKRGSSRSTQPPEGKLRKWNAKENMERDSSSADFGDARTSSTVSIPDLNINSSNLRMDGELTEATVHSDGMLRGDIPMKELNFDSPSYDPEDSYQFNLGDLGLSGALGAPDIDIETKRKGDLNLNGDADIDVNTDGKAGFGFKLPGFKKPKADVKGNIEMGDLKVKAPDTSIDVDLEGDAKSDWKLPGFKKPKANVDLPDADIKVQGPDFDVDAPNLKVKAPDADIDFDLDGDARSGFNLPDWKLPGFKKPKANLPDADIKVRGPDFDVNAPDVNVNAPDVDIDGDAKGGFHLPDWKLPGFKKPKAKVDLPDADITVKGPEFNVDAPDVKVKAPNADIDVDLEGDAKGGFHLPDWKLPGFKKQKANVDLPDADINIRGPDFNFETPDVKVKAPNTDIDLDIDGDAKGGFHLPDWKLPGFKKPKANVDLPDADIKVRGPNFDVDAPDVKVKAPDADFDVDLDGDAKGGFHLPDWKLPGFKKPKANVDLPDADIKVRGPNFDVDAPDVNVKAPDADFDVDLDGDAKGGFHLPDWKLPGFKKPKANVDLPDADTKVRGPDFDVNAPDLNVNAPDVDIDVDAKGGFHLPDWKLPGFKKPKAKVDLPDADITVKSPEFDVDVPDVKMKAPNADIDVDLEGDSKGGFHLPDWKLPGFKKPKAKVDLPDADIKVKGPNLNVDAPDVKVKDLDAGIDVDAKGGFDLPDWKLPGFKKPKAKVDLPDADIKVKGLDFDVNAPDVKLKAANAEIDVEGDGKGGFHLPDWKLPGFKKPKTNVDLPDADIKVKGPDFDVNAPDMKVRAPDAHIDVDLEGDAKGGFNLPDWKLPGFKKPKSNLPEADVKLKGPNINIDVPDVKVKAPDADIDAKGGFELPDWKLPGFKKPKAKVDYPDADVKVKGPDFNVDAPDVKLKAPDADIDVDIDGDAKGGFHLPDWKLPGFRKPKASLPDADIKVKGTKLNVDAPDVKVKAPDAHVDAKGGFDLPDWKLPGFKKPKANVEIPDADVKVRGPDFDAPDVNVKGPHADIDVNMEGEGKGGFHLPDWKLPGFKKPKAKVDLPDADLKVRGPDFDIDAPDVNVKGPQADIDVDMEGDGKGGIHLPDWKLPGFKKPKANVDLPDADLKVRGPDFDIEAPDVNVKGPHADIDVDMEGDGKGGFHLPDWKLPGFKKPKGKVDLPDADINVKGPQFNVDAPDVKVKAPNADIDAKGGFDLPDWKLPGFKKPKAKVDLPDADINVKGPQFNVDAPDVKVKAPNADIDAKGGFDLPDWKLPGFKKPKAKVDLPDADINVKGPQFNVDAPDVNVKAPNAEIDAKGGFDLPDWKLPGFKKPKAKVDLPDADINVKGPQFNVDAPDVKVKAPNADIDAKGGFDLPDWKLPGFKKPKVNADLPDADIEFKGPNFDVNAPAVKVKPPNADIDVDIEGDAKGGFHLPDWKLPGFKKSKANVDLPDADIKVKGPDFDVDAPELKVKAPNADINVDIDSDAKGGFKLPDWKLPGFKKPKAKVDLPDADIKVRGPDFDVNVPDVNVNVPDVDMDADAKGGFHLPDWKLPGFKKPKTNVDLPDADIKVKGPDFNVDAPDVKLKAPGADIDVDIDGDAKGGFHLPDWKLPGFKKPKSNLPDADFEIKGPNLNVETPDVKVKAPNADIDTKGGFDLPDWKLPGFKKPKAKVDLPDADIKVKGLDFDVNAPDVKVKAPNADIDVDIAGDAKGGFHLPDWKLPGFKKPKANVDLPDADIKVKGPDFDVNAPDVNVKAPNADIEVDAKGGFDLPDWKLPGFKKPKAKVNVPDADIKFNRPDFDVDAPDIKVKAPDAKIDVDLEGDAKGGFHLPDWKLPGFKKPKTNVDLPDADIEVKGLNFNVDAPDVKVKAPDADINADTDGDAKGGFHLPDWKLPGFKKPKGDIDFPDADIKVKGPDFDVDSPSIKVKAPDANTDIDLEGGSYLPDWKLPGFKTKANVDLPDADIKVKGPDFDVEAPDVKVKAPHADIDVDMGGDGKGGFHLPDWRLPGFKKPKANVDLPDADIKVKGLDFDVNAPNVNVKAPNADIDVDLESGVKSAGIKLPESKKPKAEVALPAGDIHVKGDIEFGDVNVKAPGAPEVNISKPDFKISAPDVNVSKPVQPGIKGKGDVKIKGEGKEKKSGFKLPHFKFPGRKKNKKDVKVPGLDVPEADVKISGPDIKLSGPDVKLSGQSVKVSGPKFPAADLQVSGPGVSIDDVKLSAPDVPGANINIPAPDVSVGEINAPRMPAAGVGMPEARMPGFKKSDITAAGPDVSVGEINAPRMPTAGVGMTGARMPGFSPQEINVEGPDVSVGEINAPRMPTAGVGMTGARMPGFSPQEINVEGPDVSVGEINAPRMPTAGVGMTGARMPGFSTPNIKLEGPDVSVGEINAPRMPTAGVGMTGARMPGFSTQEINVEGPDVGVGEVNAPSMPTAGVGMTGARMPGFSKSDINVEGPDVSVGEINAPRMPTAGVGMTGARMPGFSNPDVDLPHINVTQPDIDVSGIKLPGIKGAADISGPNIDVSSKVKFPSAKIPEVSGPTVRGSLEAPGVNLPYVSVPDVEISADGSSMTGPSITAPDAELSGAVEAPGFDVSVSEPGFTAPEISVPGVSLKREESKEKKRNSRKKSEDKKSGIQNWWSRRRRRRSSSSSHSDHSTDEEDNKMSLDIPLAASVNVPTGSVGNVTPPSATVPSASTTMPVVSADIDPTVTFDKPSIPNVTLSSGESTISGPVISVPSRRRPDLTSITAPSVSFSTPGSEASAAKADADISQKTFSVSTPHPDTRYEITGMHLDMSPSVAQEVEVRTEPDMSLDYESDDFAETSNWYGELNVPNVDINMPDEPDVPDASLNVNIDQDSILIRDYHGMGEEASDDEDEQESVRAMLREYFSETPQIMDSFGFSSEPPTEVELKSDLSDDTMEYLSRNGEALTGARREIRRRSQSSSPARRKSNSGSFSSSRSSSPSPGRSQGDSLPALDASLSKWSSESPTIKKKSTGGVAYDITPIQFEHMTAEQNVDERGEPRGGLAYFVDINDQLKIKDDQEEEKPPLVSPWNIETETVTRKLRTNHFEDSSEDEAGTSTSKSTLHNPSIGGKRDSDLTFKTEPVASTTTVTRGVLEHEKEGNKTYTVTITTSQIDDSEA